MRGPSHPYNNTLETTLDALIYPRERTLGTLTLVLGLIAWIAIIAGTFGIALVYLLMAFVFYIFAQSALIAWIRGTAVQITPGQFPDLHQRLQDCCRKLEIDTLPEAYLLHGGGAFNAFATRFFGRNFVVLYSDIVDAMENDPEGINFYLGHELGHIRMKHLTGRLWRMPVLWLPLLGAAYARAKEYTCDRHGRACCASTESAARALAAISAGARRWATVDLASYAGQAQAHRGFWLSFHELIGGYPWLSKRVAHCLDPQQAPPARHPLAYVLAFFVPYGGRAAGGAAGVLVTVAIIGILAAVAIPAYQDYTQRAQVSQIWLEAAPVRTALARHYASKRTVPASFQAAGTSDTLPGGQSMSLNRQNMVVEIQTRAGVLVMEPKVSPSAPDGVAWNCLAGEGLRPAVLPAACRR